MDEPIKVTNVFHRNVTQPKTCMVNRGGAGSSKTWSIIQILTERFFTIKGRQILILRKALPSLRISILPFFNRYLSLLNMKDKVRMSKQTLDCTFGDQLIHFGSLDDPEKIKSSEWNDIWLEEATEFSYEDYVITETRLRAPNPGKQDPQNQIYLSFNPEDEFSWIKEKIIDGKGREFTEVASSYKDNPFLPISYVRRLLALEEQDPNYYRIYAKGEWGKLENLIYRNWDIVKTVPTDRDLPVIYGLDFGYTHPTALVRLTMDEEDYWIEELLYAVGLTNQDLVGELKELIPEDKRDACPLCCDSAEADRIMELGREGFNVFGATKGAGSVKNGIDLVKRFKTHITEESVNLIKEKKRYSWRKDNLSGRTIEEPVKWNDHLMDAERYAISCWFRDIIGMEPRLRWV